MNEQSFSNPIDDLAEEAELSRVPPTKDYIREMEHKR